MHFMTAHFNCTPKTPFTLPAVCVRLHKVMAEPQSSPVQCVSRSLSGLCRAAIRKTVFITAARYVRPTAGWQAGRKRGRKGRWRLRQLRHSNMEESRAGVVAAPGSFRWARSADVSCLPCANGFVHGPKRPASPLPHPYSPHRL